MYMPAFLNEYPGYTGISGHLAGIHKYAGLADDLYIPARPFLDNPA
jgi:hypothetical protein